MSRCASSNSGSDGAGGRAHERYRLRRISKVFPRGKSTFTALSDVSLTIPDKRVRRDRGAIRLRQDHAAAHGGRPGEPVVGGGAGRRPAGEWPGRRSSGGVPAIRALPLEDGAREHRVRAQMQRGAAREARRAGVALYRADGDVGHAGQLSSSVVGRHAAARRHRALLCDRARGAADGRAFRIA